MPLDYLNVTIGFTCDGHTSTITQVNKITSHSWGKDVAFLSVASL